MAKRAEVDALAMDPNHKVPVVLLRVEDDERFVPIWIGLMEASAIMLAIEGVEVERPMTHDLLCALLQTCGGVVTRVEVTDLRDGTYFAEVTVEAGGTVHVIDSRPSDAIAVALRVDAPIFVHDRVLAKVEVDEQPVIVEDPDDADGEATAAETEEGAAEPRAIPALSEQLDTDEDEMRKILEQLSPDDFKYKQ